LAISLHHCAPDRENSPPRVGSLAVFDRFRPISQQSPHFPEHIPHTDPLPIAGTVELDLPVGRLWEAFLDVPGWSSWNPCIWRSRVRGGALREGATLIWAFNPIKRRYLYKLPVTAEIVELVECERITWEVRLPGFHALHSYRFAALGEHRCQFGSWEVAEGPAYRALSRFWLAHFRYVCRESLAGAQTLS
jgi:Polyketide cyclase / dehydrase and lipid transport